MFKTTKIKAGLILSIIFATIVPTTALASTVGDTATQNVGVTLEGGGFSITAPGIKTFSTFNLDEVPNTISTGFTAPFEVQDSRGTHAGYRVDVRATQLEHDSGSKLPTGSLTLAGVSKITQKDTSAPAPTASFNDTKAIDGSAVPVLSAKTKAGMGRFNFAFPDQALFLELNYATVQQGKYTTTLTWSLITAP